MDIFHDSYLRANVIAWLPIQKTDQVCYVGDGAGVIADKLKSLSDSVSVFPKAADIARDGYDYVVSLGGISEDAARACHKALSEKGKLVFAADNAYGLKFLAGVKDAGSGEYFGSVEALEGSEGRTREEIEAILSAAGFQWRQFYYPFPDFRFAMSVYSDGYLPKRGELIDQIGNFDSERLALFDEAKAMDAALARGKFQDFSNSFLVAAGKSDAARLTNSRGEQISYVKFSNDRGDAHKIRTYITVSEDGKSHLRKMADCGEAEGHIAGLRTTAEKLKELYEGSRLSINACKPCADGMELEFLQGHTMEEELDRLIGRGEYEKATEKMLGVLEEIRSCKGMSEFQVTEEFRKIFGEVSLPSGLMAADVSDIDLIMPNILVAGDGGWTVIDYEWSFHFPIPVNFTIYRGIRYYADTTAERHALGPGLLYQKAGISKQELAAYEEMEEAFQAHVLGGHVPMRELYKEAGKPAYHVSSILHVVDDLERRRALQVYFDRGNGFCESDTVTYHGKALDGTYHLEIPVGADIKRLRIDPGSQACTVDVKRLAWKGGGEEVLDFVSNGHRMEGNAYLFDTDDPNILLERLPDGPKKLLLDCRIDSMSLAAAEWIAPRIDARYRLKKMLKK